MTNLVTLKHQLQKILCEDAVLIESSNLKQIFEKLLPLGSANLILLRSNEESVGKIQKFLDALFSKHSKNAVPELVKVLKHFHFNAVAGE